jgi:NitT/TauT family transport system permease protein
MEMENTGISTELTNLSNVKSKKKNRQKSTLKYLENKEPTNWALNIGRVAVFCLILVCWELGARFKIIDPFFWSLPSEIFGTWLQLIREGTAWKDTLFTFQSTVYGFVIGTLGGAAIGLSFWWSKLYAKIAEPFIIMFEAMPKLALAPIIVLIFGLGLSSKVAMAVAITLVITTLTTYNGLKQVDNDLIRMIYSLGATRFQVFAKVVVPWTMPSIISALRINIGLALTGAIVGEYIGSTNGIGRMIFYAGQTYEISLIWAGIFNLSLLSMILYLLVSQLEKVLLAGMLHQK